MKQLSLFALALAFSLNASAGIYCIDQNKTIAVFVDGNGSTQRIQNTRVRAEVESSKLQGKLDLNGFIHLNNNGKRSLLSGDPDNGLDLEISSLSDSLNALIYNSELFMSIKGKQIETNVACVDEDTILKQ